MIIFGSPGRYIQGPGTLDRIGEEVGRLGKSAVLVADAVVDGLVGGRVAAGCDAAGVALRKLANKPLVSHAPAHGGHDAVQA